MDCKLKSGGYLIEGSVYNITGAVQHIEANGFTRGEALEYIKS